MSGFSPARLLSRCMMLCVLTLGLLLACKKREAKPSPKQAQVLKPLVSPAARIELDAKGFEKAIAFVPVGARTPRPIVIGIHGSKSSATELCERLQKLAGRQVFIVCPRGKAPDFAFTDPGTTSNELRSSLLALKTRFAAHVAQGSVILVGVERGAEHAAHIAREESSFFSRVVLVLGGVESWSPTHASIFGQRGGSKLLMISGSRAAADEAELRAILTRRAGADARVVFAGESLNVRAEQVWSALDKEWKWLIAGDQRWANAR